MTRALLAALVMGWAFSALALPSACQEIESFDPALYERDYDMLEEMRDRCEAALSNSPDAKAREAIASVQWNKELEIAHQARIAERTQAVERVREIVERFRSPTSRTGASGAAHTKALEDLDTLERTSGPASQQGFARYLPAKLAPMLVAPAGASDETLALIGAVRARIASAAARSDQHLASIDSLLKEVVGTSREAITRLRAGAALAADRSSSRKLAEGVSQELLGVQAEVAFARFASRVKARETLLQAAAFANAGARNAARDRVAYLDRAYLAFSEGLPQSLRASVSSGAAANFLRQLEAARQEAANLADAEAESRMTSYIRLRSREFESQKLSCLARAGGSAPGLGKLERDLSALSEFLKRLHEPGLRIFIQESIVDRLEVARSLCKEAA